MQRSVTQVNDSEAIHAEIRLRMPQPVGPVTFPVKVISIEQLSMGGLEVIPGDIRSSFNMKA